MGSSSLTRKIFDEVRKIWVKATPEEQVRQLWLQRMSRDLGYPRELIVVERAIKELPHLASAEVPDRRLDILCYGKGGDSALFPLLLIECKDERITEGALNQVIGYNHYIGAHFTAAVNQAEVRFRYFDKAKNQYIFCDFLPTFKELMQWVTR